MTDQNVKLILGKLDAIQADVAELKTDVAELQNRVVGLETHLENVTDRNIQLIAEGHYFLNRKLDEALRNDNDITMFKIKVNILAEDVELLKKKVLTDA